MSLRTVITTLLLLCFCQYALAQGNGKHSTSVEVVRNYNYTRNGPQELLTMYAKYHIEKPSIMRRAGTQKGGTPATSYDQEKDWLCTVTVDGADFNLKFDTASSDLWLFSSNMNLKTKLTSHKLFKPHKSPNYQKIHGATWSIVYGDGSSASGRQVGTAPVTVGALTVTSQAVEPASSASSAFVTDTAGAFSGVMGFAFDSLNQVSPTKQATWFSNIRPDLQQPLFTVNLVHNSGYGTSTGSFNFGYIDGTQYEEGAKPHYEAATAVLGYWAFRPSGYQVGFGSLTPVSGSVGAIADTGSPFILMPNAFVDAYYAQVYGAQFSSSGWTFPCNSGLPNLCIGMGSIVDGVAAYEANIPGKYLNYQTLKTTASASTCLGGLQYSNDNTRMMLGEVFFKSQFVIFNFGASLDGRMAKLGFAPKYLT